MRTRITKRRRGWSLLTGLLAVATVVVTACSPSPSPSGGAGAPDRPVLQGMKIVFFPGGTAGGGFETVVYNGAKAAEAAFGPTVTYQWSDWDPEQDDHPVPARRSRPSPTASRSWVTRATTRSTR